MFGCFLWIGLFGRFARKTLERAAFIGTMSAQKFWSQACVAIRLSCLLSEVHTEKSETSSTSFGKGK
jgi:hypothetical protein